jgi:hypothetical protein
MKARRMEAGMRSAISKSAVTAIFQVISLN